MHVRGVDGVSQASTHRHTNSLADERAELRARPAGRLELGEARALEPAGPDRDLRAALDASKDVYLPLLEHLLENPCFGFEGGLLVHFLNDNFQAEISKSLYMF